MKFPIIIIICGKHMKRNNRNRTNNFQIKINLNILQSFTLEYIIYLRIHKTMYDYFMCAPL